MREFVAASLDDACPYCGQELTARNFSLGHLVPTGRGGGLGGDNLEVCCQRCNQVNGALTEREFLTMMSLLDGWEPRARQDVLKRLRAGG